MKMISSNSKNFLLYLFANYFIKLSGFLGQFVLLHFASEYVGLYKISWTTVEILAVISILGLNTSIVKIVSRGIGCKKNDYAFVLQMILFSSTLLSMIAFVLANNNILSEYDDVNNFIKMLIWLIVPLNINTIFVLKLQMDENFRLISKVQTLTKCFGLLFIIMFTYLWKVEGYIVGTYISVLSTTLFLIFVCRDIFIRATSKIQLTLINIKLHFKISSYSFLANVINIINKYLSIIVLNYYMIDTLDLKLYGIALIFFVGLEIFSNSFQQYILPKLAKLSDNDSEVFLLTKSYEKYLFIFSFIVILLVSFNLTVLYEFQLFGDISSSKFILISFSLLVGWFISTFYLLKGPAFICVGKTDLNFKVTLIVLPINIISTWLLVESFGFFGVISSRIVFSLVNLIVFNYFFKRHFNSVKIQLDK